jgi:hypothetical protein
MSKPVQLQSVFAEITVLFPSQHQTDPIEAFIRQLQGKDRSGRKRENKIRITFGNHLDGEEILILPTNDQRTFSGSEIAKYVVDSYNQDYWLVALWNKMLKNAEGSALAREIVRSIIKHCIFLTAEDIGKFDCQVDTLLLKNNRLDNRVTYYKRVFHWGDIWRCMREPYKSRVLERLQRNNEAKLAHRIDRVSLDSLGQHLSEINLILGSSNLPTVAANSTAQKTNMAGILKTIYLSALFWHDSSQLRSALRTLIMEETRS